MSKAVINCPSDGTNDIIRSIKVRLTNLKMNDINTFCFQSLGLCQNLESRFGT